MKTSRFFINTLRESPNDAEIISHKLMIKAGLIRKNASGIYSWLPLGLKILRKVENIVRKEMEACGAQEVLMPGVVPSELWIESKRWEEYGPELLRIEDRHSRAFCLGPTHEEVITSLVRNEITSYKQLPINFFQIQTKFRDEIRPRFGIMRAREFLMKDAYSFHTSQKSLDATYSEMFNAYSNIFKKLHLEFRAVIADTGNIGGSGSHEFHVLADSGEDFIASNESGSYAANLEMVGLNQKLRESDKSEKSNEIIETPNVRTIKEVAKFFNTTIQNCIKTLLITDGDNYFCICVRGDHEINFVKLKKLLTVEKELTMASEKDVFNIMGCPIGSVGPMTKKCPVYVDNDAFNCIDFVCGANLEGFHLQNANWDRKQIKKIADIRNAVDGDPSPDGNGILKIKKGIEVGHIFKLGTKYSNSMKAFVTDSNGDSIPMIMGCYGIGISRIVAAAIEQNHDENGIIWPPPIAPFLCAVVPINSKKSQLVNEQAEKIYQQLSELNIEVILCDQNKRPGVLFSDLDLMGIPIRIVLSEKNIKNGKMEIKLRKHNEIVLWDLNHIQSFVKKFQSGEIG